MAMQKEKLAEFIQSSNRKMYGLSWEPTITKLDILEKKDENENQNINRRPPMHQRVMEWPTQE